MKFATILKNLFVLTAVSLLVACGGGTSGGDSAYQPAQMRITVTPTATSVRAGTFINLAVRVTQANGTTVGDGTTVSGTVSPAANGRLQVESNGALGGTSGTTVGGLVNYRFTGAGAGGATQLTFSTTDPASPGRSISSTVTIQVNTTGPDPRLQLAATKASLPVNHFGVLPFLGSPYMSEVTVTVKDANGQAINAKNGIQVSLNPVDNTGGFSTLDDPETQCKPEESLDGCEFLIRMGQAPVDVVAGKATIFVHSLGKTGSSTLTITTLDPVTQDTVTASMVFQFVDNLPPLPTQLSMSGPDRPIYVQGSGGNDSGALRIRIDDALGQPVPEPVSGSTAYNNFRLELIGTQPNTAPRLSALNAAGVVVSGSKIDLRTTSGIGTANFISGSGTGSFRVRLTADRADNNVDNGISDPVVLERSVVVSDGKLWDLEITFPTVSALFVNPQGGNTVQVNGNQVPGVMDGTYSLTVGVIATDRQGNPVLPGTVINFGLVDEPQTPFGSGDFYMAGGDGDPQEGGTLFTADGGCFANSGGCTTPVSGGAAGPGDTLLIMSEHVLGNRDLEGARLITQVNSRRSLTVNYRFNHNDTTGQSVDYHGILPYIVGRAADGNIHATGATDANGVATTRMNYPQSRLGKVVTLWAQGDGPVVGGQPKKVADVEYAWFAGLANAMISVSPAVLPANVTAPVQVCVSDALGAPVGNVDIGFAFQGPVGQGWVDGVPMSGTTADPTRLGTGCTTAMVRTTGMLAANSDDARLVFHGAGATAEVKFSFLQMILQASPSVLRHSGLVTLTLLNSSGLPQAGSQIVGTCQGENGTLLWLDPLPGVTDSNGKTTTFIREHDLDQLGQAGGGKCIFKTADGLAQVEVLLKGEDLCKIYTSPLPAGCPNIQNFSLTTTVDASAAAAAGTYNLTSMPVGVACSTTDGAAPLTCTPTPFPDGTTVTLVATPSASFDHWEGDCAPESGAPSHAIVFMNSAKTCKAIWH